MVKFSEVICRRLVFFVVGPYHAMSHQVLKPLYLNLDSIFDECILTEVVFELFTAALVPPVKWSQSHQGRFVEVDSFADSLGKQSPR